MGLSEFRGIERSRFEIILPLHREITEKAREIAKVLTPYTCVHVRRGDRVTSPQINTDTSCPNILDKIKRCGLATAYIMTDEELGFFDALRNTHFTIRFYSDFSELSNIEDNFLLFCIEKEIMRMANKRVSTFRVLEFLPEEDYYAFHLSQEVGWQ